MIVGTGWHRMYHRKICPQHQTNSKHITALICKNMHMNHMNINDIATQNDCNDLKWPLCVYIITKSYSLAHNVHDSEYNIQPDHTWFITLSPLLADSLLQLKLAILVFIIDGKPVAQNPLKYLKRTNILKKTSFDLDESRWDSILDQAPSSFKTDSDYHPIISHGQSYLPHHLHLGITWKLGPTVLTSYLQPHPPDWSCLRATRSSIKKETNGVPKGSPIARKEARSCGSAIGL